MRAIVFSFTAALLREVSQLILIEFLNVIGLVSDFLMQGISYIRNFTKSQDVLLRPCIAAAVGAQSTHIGDSTTATAPLGVLKMSRILVQTTLARSYAIDTNSKVR